jgi:hypothetical protein
MKSIIIICLFVACTKCVCAQTGKSLEVNEPATSNGYGLVRFNNPSGDNQKSNDIDLNDVAGSPYFNNDWNIGIITLSNDKAIRVPKVKLNLCNNELHFIDSTGKEMVADDGNIKKLCLIDAKDTSKVAWFNVLKNYNGRQGRQYLYAGVKPGQYSIA